MLVLSVESVVLGIGQNMHCRLSVSHGYLKTDPDLHPDNDRSREGVLSGYEIAAGLGLHKPLQRKQANKIALVETCDKSPEECTVEPVYSYNTMVRMMDARGIITNHQDGSSYLGRYLSTLDCKGPVWSANQENCNRFSNTRSHPLIVYPPP